MSAYHPDSPHGQDDQKLPEAVQPPMPAEPEWRESMTTPRPGHTWPTPAPSGSTGNISPQTWPPAYHPSAAGYQQPWPGYGSQQPGQPWPGQPTRPWPGYGNQQTVQPWPGYNGQQPVQQWPGHSAYQAYPGYPPGYGYYPWQPAGPKRDTYLLVVAITAFTCSILVIIGGIAAMAFFGLVDLMAQRLLGTISHSELFQVQLEFLASGLIGIVGGSFCLYHSIRALFLRKPSSLLRMPQFWIFLISYLVVLYMGYVLYAQNDTVNAVTGFLIFLAGLFPALTILSLGVRNLSRSSDQGMSVVGPTTWRRFTLALISGATLSVWLAAILELILTSIVLGGQSSQLSHFLNSNSNGMPDPSLYGGLLIVLSVIAPLVEETIKPLAVVLLIGRIQSKAEAFALGLACGIGFNLVETTTYISSGYHDWLNVALIRSGAGLLHGLGAAMVSLGWYCLTHKEEGSWTSRIAKTLACWVYAVFQHALWNGLWILIVLPGSAGTFFRTWIWSAGPFTIDATELLNLAEMVLILIFFLYMSRILRPKTVQTREPERKIETNLPQVVPGS